MLHHNRFILPPTVCCVDEEDAYGVFLKEVKPAIFMVVAGVSAILSAWLPIGTSNAWCQLWKVGRRSEHKVYVSIEK